MHFPRFTWTKPYARKAQTRYKKSGTRYKKSGTLELILAVQPQFCPLMDMDHAMSFYHMSINNILVKQDHAQKY